ncbi:hydrolase [Acrocarpospora corrugata]|uniref:Hydrolase n=1 Tax=Acrocarpospora corrugata TaxID=35763 RepID=A0A5M3VYU0_9ACTN|nr:alpha/beta hydrolase [Acrocarpospora corrugata]GES01604.1 hydrolase [Acrocarpospora corrugata]
MHTHHHYEIVDGQQLFYREAGSPGAPVVVLLHGFPTSSFMFRDLIPQLADRYRVIAPDYLGFGFSDAPPAGEFDYSFDVLAQLTAGLLDQLGVTEFAMYVQDYGAPIGWRLALANPDSVWAIVTQNGNAYEEGFVQDFWQPVWAYTHAPTPQTEAGIRDTFDVDGIRWQYLHGVPDPSVVSPDTWEHDAQLLNRPGNDLVQLQLFRDYESNVVMYPAVHEYFRTTQVPLLAVWGRNDGIFGPPGANAFRADLPNARIELLDGGHFLLESEVDQVASLMRDFLAPLRPTMARSAA